jgi:hypothetical protein
MCSESRQVGSCDLQIEGNREFEELKCLFLFLIDQRPLVGQGPSLSKILSHSDTPRSERLHWTSDQSEAETAHNIHNREIYIPLPPRIRIRNPSKQEATAQGVTMFTGK